MDSSSLELKIPPVIVVAIAALLMWICAWMLPELDMALPGRIPAAMIAVLAALALLGWGIFLGHPVSIAVLFAFVGYMNRYQIIPEERALQALFGDAFKSYCATVRRWL